MTTPGRLTVDKSGRVRGPASIDYNDPWPCVNGRYPVTGAMQGVLMHTMVGNLAGTIASFNDPARQASAHFGISQQGHIHQFGPLGTGWEAWHAMAANLTWYGIEHADNGDQHNPLTAEQVTASAQLVECLSAFAGFPLQVTDSTSGHGYGTHVMGGAAWGGHTCPGPGPRAGQRGDIVALARQIRAAATGPQRFPSGRWQYNAKTMGNLSLSGLADRQGCDVADIWWETANLNSEHWIAEWGPLQRTYLNGGRWGFPLPDGIVLWLP